VTTHGVPAMGSRRPPETLTRVLRVLLRRPVKDLFSGPPVLDHFFFFLSSGFSYPVPPNNLRIFFRRCRADDLRGRPVGPAPVYVRSHDHLPLCSSGIEQYPLQIKDRAARP
jgi:hypothetical protein